MPQEDPARQKRLAFGNLRPLQSFRSGSVISLVSFSADSELFTGKASGAAQACAGSRSNMSEIVRRHCCRCAAPSSRSGRRVATHPLSGTGGHMNLVERDGLSRMTGCFLGGLLLATLFPSAAIAQAPIASSNFLGA